MISTGGVVGGGRFTRRRLPPASAASPSRRCPFRGHQTSGWRDPNCHGSSAESADRPAGGSISAPRSLTPIHPAQGQRERRSRSDMSRRLPSSPGDTERTFAVDDDVDDLHRHGLSVGSVGGTYGTVGSRNSRPSPVSQADTEVISATTNNATVSPLRPRTARRLPVASQACLAVLPPPS